MTELVCNIATIDTGRGAISLWQLCYDSSRISCFVLCLVREPGEMATSGFARRAWQVTKLLVQHICTYGIRSEAITINNSLIVIRSHIGGATKPMW